MAELEHQNFSQNQDYNQAQYNQANQMAQLEAELKSVMPKILDPVAMERLSMIKATKPDFAMQVQIYLASLYQQGTIRQPLNDEIFHKILGDLVKKPQWNIKRK